MFVIDGACRELRSPTIRRALVVCTMMAACQSPGS